jgi:hypothetical protein
MLLSASMSSLCLAFNHLSIHKQTNKNNKIVTFVPSFIDYYNNVCYIGDIYNQGDQNMSENKERNKWVSQNARLYAMRRLVRRGQVTVADIMRATKCSLGTANAIMRFFIDNYPDTVLRKEGPRLRLMKEPPDAWLKEASDAQLLSAVENNGGELETGLKPSEFPVRIQTWSHGHPPDGVMTQIAKCLVHQASAGIRMDHRASLEIKYTGMSRGNTSKWRRILPIGVERVLDQWRLMAQDLEKDGFPLRTFVLARIENVRPATEPLPKTFRLYTFDDVQSLCSVSLNPDLTPDQEKAIRNEIGLSMENNTVQLQSRASFEFLRRFGPAQVSENAVWPIITDLEIKKQG